MTSSPKQRLAYIDWMRGLACLAMFQTHCYDSWLSESERHTQFFKWSQMLGGLPAPLFLFLAGLSFAMVTDKLRLKDVPTAKIARQTILRGAEILGLGYLFRLQEFTLGYFRAPWTDLLRVDVLNIIGVSLMLLGALNWVIASTAKNSNAGAIRIRNIISAACVSLAITLVTPPLWTNWRPRFLPWYLESYINGVHIFDKPQSWLFPVFPWTAFAFAGLAVGFFLMTPFARQNGLRAVAWIAAAGVAIYAVAHWADTQPRQFYSEYDFWHTSPNFFLIRLAVLFAITLLAFVWCKWGLPAKVFSPLVQLGQTSLLVYWVHIEFVYGGFSILKRKSQTIASASAGLVIIFISMLILSILRTRFKGRGKEILDRVRNRSADSVQQVSSDGEGNGPRSL